MFPALGLIALVSCATLEPEANAAPMLAAEAPTAQPADPNDVPSPVPTWDGLPLGELTHVDLRGTARSAQVLLDEVQGLAPRERKEAAEALRALQLTCPYNRASVQLPLALHVVVSMTNASHLDPLIQSDWAYLQRGLADHVAILDALGADLPLPAEGDYLYGKLFPDAPITRDLLVASSDPIAATTPLLASISFVVDEYDDATKASIDRHSSVLEASTAHRWPLKGQLIGWRTGLLRMQPFLTDDARKQQVEQMIFAIDQYVGLYC